MARAPGTPSAPPQAPVDYLLGPLREFLHWESAGGVLLMVGAAAALIWANTPGADAYARLWHTPLSVGVGEWALSMSLLHGINDLLMAVFFFLVGLEIKRELLVGELASPRRALLPIAAAIGGMALPGALYAAVTLGTPAAAGWGIPMATDIAFAIGVLTLLGARAPLALKVFLTALAIVDDLGAVLVIAVFYSGSLSAPALSASAAVLVLMYGMNRAGVRHPYPYAFLGAVPWLAVHASGLHATLAGVLAAFTIPAGRRGSPQAFARAAGEALETLATPGREEAALLELEAALERVQSPMQRLEHRLLPWVSLVIMPLFALANAGVPLGAAAEERGAALGILLGLLVGKPVGIAGGAWLAVRLGLADLPASVRWRQVWGAGLLGGIGFTMSIFIAGLAFADPARLAEAKLAILAASLVAGAAGWGLLRAGSPNARLSPPPAA